MVNRKSHYWIAALVALIAFGGWMSCETSFAANQAETQAKPPAQTASRTSQDHGERVFMANCSRCHKPPMTIPPQITGTVVMHMRVRARLSRQDEQALLRYLAP
jgi:cytochrome c5